MKKQWSYISRITSIVAVIFCTLGSSLAFLESFIGPSGGTGGQPFIVQALLADSDGNTEFSVLREIWIKSDDKIDSIQLFWGRSEPGFISKVIGGGGGNLSKIVLNPGEHIIEIGGWYGDVIDRLRFMTDQGRKFPIEKDYFGGKGGNQVFAYKTYNGSWINGFWGRAGDKIDAIGPIIRYPNLP
jgi:Jacalin-like lectin domain